MHKCSVYDHHVVVEHHCEPIQLVGRASTTSAIVPPYCAAILLTERQHMKQICNLILQRSMLRSEEQTLQDLPSKSSTTICIARPRSNSVILSSPAKHTRRPLLYIEPWPERAAKIATSRRSHLR